MIFAKNNSSIISMAKAKSPSKKSRSTRKTGNKKPTPDLPSASDWRSTDDQERLKRKLRAQEETFRIVNHTPEHPVFSNFSVHSQSGMTYSVEIRDVREAGNACTCTDFRINGLGVCKHIEAVLFHLEKSKRVEFCKARKEGSPRVDVVPEESGQALRIERNLGRTPPGLRRRFDAEGVQMKGLDTDELLAELSASRSKYLRVSQEVDTWRESAQRERERTASRRDYETGVVEGRHPEHVTLSPLYPYQREGMLHLVFRERALLADEMGLGKTIQAIAACALLEHLGKAKRVLVVTPASLKSEWEEQIGRFTTLPLRLLFGSRNQRLQAYRGTDPPFFTICNYEQILRDSLDINEHFKPDIVVLDEAQRIKNWSTKTAQSVKRLQSRYAFVLTGTPIENRIDELQSIVDFLDPSLLGPLFRFNREHYELDEKGRPEGYRNLAGLRRKVAPVLLRRRKAEVETELPERTDRTLFVSLTKGMREEYAEYERQVGDLANKAKRRPLTAKEQDLLMIFLSMMRMICDSPGLMKNNSSRDCPKLAELERVLEESLSEPDVKAIIFSEWIGMLERVRELADRMGIGYAWHTGSVPQKKRRAEIRTFQQDPDCRLFLSTDSGGVGLNLQNASVVINCDLPWNPAKLEQRIARAWRKNQTRAVTVVNLVARETIEHGMLSTLAQKTELSDGVLDGVGNLDKMTLRRGRQAFLKRLEQVMVSVPSGPPSAPTPPSDPAAHFARLVKERLGARLVRCEESLTVDSDTPVLLAVLDGPVDREKPAVEKIFTDAPWPSGKPELTILDTKTWDALRSLAASGLIEIKTRGTRALLESDDEAVPPPLTPEELAKIKELRETAATKRRAAKALTAAGLETEAAPFETAASEAESEASKIEKWEG